MVKTTYVIILFPNNDTGGHHYLFGEMLITLMTTLLLEVSKNLKSYLGKKWMNHTFLGLTISISRKMERHTNVFLMFLMFELMQVLRHGIP
jgi:hypothetical protein